MLTWFASLIGHYKSCGYYSAYMADINGNSELFHTSKRLLVSAHSSKSAKSFTEWFVETGIFRDWLRRRVFFFAIINIILSKKLYYFTEKIFLNLNFLNIHNR